nr:MAG TPA: hypothetical protein [Caudoviricetes sp.]
MLIYVICVNVLSAHILNALIQPMRDTDIFLKKRPR